jgi:hypothetical protein
MCIRRSREKELQEFRSCRIKKPRCLQKDGTQNSGVRIQELLTRSAFDSGAPSRKFGAVLRIIEAPDSWVPFFCK